MIETVAETGSTNADLLRAAAAGAAEGQWLRAERQTSGRGRLGRDWISPPGNLYASTIVRLRADDPPATGLAFVAAVALHEVATAYAGTGRLQLKWPNDLMADKAKLAGILLERTGTSVVIGFGVNLAHHPIGLERATTSIAALTGVTPPVDGFLADLGGAFARWLACWRGEGAAAVFRHWIMRAHARGTALTVGGEAGLFEGLDAGGALLLRRADGTVATVHSGDAVPA